MAALFKKLADGAQKVVDAAQKASSATGHALSELSAELENKVSDLKEERGLKAQEEWLSSVQCNLSEPYGLVISDLRLIVETVDSPEAVSMSFEGIVRSLEHALEMAEDEKIKRDLKEIFASMIRVLLMFLEAKISYAEERNSENCNCLL